MATQSYFTNTLLFVCLLLAIYIVILYILYMLIKYFMQKHEENESTARSDKLQTDWNTIINDSITISLRTSASKTLDKLDKTINTRGKEIET